MLKEPLARYEALKLARKILNEGSVVFTSHGAGRADERNLSAVDIKNVIERGVVNNEAEQSADGRWAYKIETQKMAVIVGFEDENEMKIVSAWRKS